MSTTFKRHIQNTHVIFIYCVIFFTKVFFDKLSNIYAL